MMVKSGDIRDDMEKRYIECKYWDSAKSLCAIDGRFDYDKCEQEEVIRTQPSIHEYAMRAMQGMAPLNTKPIKDIAEIAYKIAKAMLEEGKKYND
jgi:hypothetical protein